MPQTAALLLICLAVLLTPGCKGSTEQPGATGSAKANGAYRHHFGEPPTPRQGTCYARAGYFPLADDPGRVRAVPLFIFREQEQLAHLLAALATGAWDFPPRSNLRNPYPPGSSLKITGQTEGSVTIDLTAPGIAHTSPDMPALVAAVAETAFQFEEITQVFLTVNGTPLSGMGPDGFRHDPERVVPVGEPLPLSVGGEWEKDQEFPEEFFINFDRPVVIGEIRLLDGSGREIPGEYFQTAFAMSVLLKPSEPQTLRERDPVRVAWRVSDRLSRTSKGEESFTLKRYEHEEELPLSPSAKLPGS